MFELFFLNKPTQNYPLKHYNKFDLIKRKYLEQLTIVKDYYYNKEQAVNNKHIISRLINTLLPSIDDRDIIDYLRIVDSAARLVSKQFDIVSNINVGKIQKNIFFGKNSFEILLYTESEIDIETISDNWKTLTPIRVIYNEDTALNMKIPDNTGISYIPTLNIMEIDVTLLMMMYREWYLVRMSTGQNTNINTFVSQIVLTNMLDNMLDLAIFNRYTHIAAGMPIPTFTNPHPFYMLDYTQRVDDVLDQVVNDNTDAPMWLEQQILSIPSIVSETMLGALYINHKYTTLQSKWVLILARIPYLKFLVAITGPRGVKKNLDILNHIPNMLKRLERDNIMKSRMESVPRLYMKFILDITTLKLEIKK